MANPAHTIKLMALSERLARVRAYLIREIASGKAAAELAAKDGAVFAGGEVLRERERILRLCDGFEP